MFVRSNQSTFVTSKFESSSTSHKKQKTKKNAKQKAKERNLQIIKRERKKKKLKKLLMFYMLKPKLSRSKLQFIVPSVLSFCNKQEWSKNEKVSREKREG